MMKNCRTLSRKGLLMWLISLILVLSATASTQPRETLALDGTWEIVFDPGNLGQQAEWQTSDVFAAIPSRREIRVPSCWEEIEQDYEGVAFYGRHFSAPQHWKDRTVYVQFDAVNYIAEVWLNNHIVGRHEGGYGPFEFRVDDLLRFDEDNFLSLRVIGPIVAEDKVIDGLGQNDMPHWRGAIAGGIWQSVRLVAAGVVRVEDVFVQPRLADDTVTVQLTLENAGLTSREVTVEVSILSGESPKVTVAAHTAKLSIVPDRNTHSMTLAIPDARYWSPASPHLYTARVRISDASSVLDMEDVRFGMRELTIREQRFELNGRPIYIKAAFFEGLYPTRLAYPDSIEMARREIELAKNGGFNVIRPWRKPPPPMWLDLCDEMGMMVIGGMPIECMGNWPTITPHLRDRVQNEVRTAVLRDRNRACIVQWEIFNEIQRKDLKRLKHAVSMMARHLDPTRMILDESGGLSGGASIYLPYRFEPEIINDVHTYPGAPFNDVSYDKFLLLPKVPEELEIGPLSSRFVWTKPTVDRLLIVSEIGYGSLPDLVDNNERFADEGNPLVPPYRYHRDLAKSIRGVLRESGLERVYPDLQKYCLDQQTIHSDANKRMLEAIRSNPRIGGYVVHALTGGDWVLGAGVLDLFRNPKRSYWGTKAANQPRYLAVRVQPRNVYAARGANITVTGINDLEDIAGKLTLDVLGADGAIVGRTEKPCRLVSGVRPLHTEQLVAKQLAGSYTLRTRLTTGDGSLVAEQKVPFDVFGEQDLTAPSGRIAVLDVDNSLRPFLTTAGVNYVEFGAGTPTSLPVFVAKAIATSKQAKGQFQALSEFVRQGGTAVYLQTAVYQEGAPLGEGELPSRDILPVSAKLRRAVGLWVCVSHIVTDHPAFDGLPVNCMMGQIYENVWSPHTFVETEGDLIVGSVSHDFFKGNEDMKTYRGPGPAWYGMDLGVIPRGRGRYVLCGLRIIENLGRDPVADKILLNLIDWVNTRDET